MQRIFAVILFCAGILCLAQAQVPMTGAGLPKPGGAACSAPTLNGSARTTTAVYTNPNNIGGLTTAGGGRIIYVVAAINGYNSGADTIAFSDAASQNVLAFTTPRAGPSVAGNTIVSAYAVAGVALTADAIRLTITPGAGVSYTEAVAFGVAGANTTAKFDANGSIPNVVTTGALAGSTSHTCDFILAAFRGGPLTSDGGWTSLINVDFAGVEYMPVTTTQTGLSPTFGGGYNGAILDAIVSP